MVRGGGSSRGSFRLARGDAAVWETDLSAGPDVPGFVGDEALTATVWTGTGEAFEASAEWVAPGPGVAAGARARVTAGSALSWGLRAGVWRLTVRAGDRTGFEGTVSVSESPGSSEFAGAAPEVGLAELREIWPELDRLCDPTSDSAGFREACSEARSWFLESAARLAGRWRRSEWERRLSAGRLRSTAATRRAQAYRAAGRILEGRPESDGSEARARRAREFLRRADWELTVMDLEFEPASPGGAVEVWELGTIEADR